MHCLKIAFFVFFFVTCSWAELSVQEIQPFVNERKTELKITTPATTIFKKHIAGSDNKALVYRKDKTIFLKGDTNYNSFTIVNNSNTAQDVRFEISNNYSDITTNLNIVSQWYQAGKGVGKNNKYKVLTKELLLKKDYDLNFKDRWVNVKNKWCYDPPDLPIAGNVSSKLDPSEEVRLLLRINVSAAAKPGDRTLSLIGYDKANKIVVNKKVDISISKLSVDYKLNDKFDKFIYTMMALDPNVGIPGSYINNQSICESEEAKTRRFDNQIKLIRSYGFNGVVYVDWRDKYLKESLGILKNNGITKVSIYSRSPVATSNSIAKIVNKKNVDIIKSFGFLPLFYGYDEPGGNDERNEQLELNKLIYSVGGKSINGIYWNDREIVNVANQKGVPFSYIAYSMGSNGNVDFFKTLPLNKLKFTKQLAYWHPNVEDPAANRLFAGFWLWASGLDGVIPHPLMALPHVARFPNLKKMSDVSPYNDFGFWQPDNIFRHHMSVYPAKKGLVNTLQWEALHAGQVDLALVLMLEKISTKPAAKALLEEIKKSVLAVRATDLPDQDSYNYMVKMEDWKKRIILLLSS